jgi:hypothetical protein
MLLRSRLRPVALIVLVLGFGLAGDGVAHANQGILYGPEDAVVVGGAPAPTPNPDDPTGKLEPVFGVRGYCIPWSMLATFHVGFGTTFARSGPDARWVYMDLSDGVRCGRSPGGNPMMPGLVLMPRVGYTFEAVTSGDRSNLHAHLGRIGLGIGYGHAMATIMYMPQVLVGTLDGVPARGMRNGMLVSLGSDLFTVELSHQALFAGGRAVTDLRVSGSLNLLMLAYVLGH